MLIDSDKLRLFYGSSLNRIWCAIDTALDLLGHLWWMSEAATLAIPAGDPVPLPGGPPRSEYPNSSRLLNQPHTAIDGPLNEAKPVSVAGGVGGRICSLFFCVCGRKGRMQWRKETLLLAAHRSLFFFFFFSADGVESNFFNDGGREQVFYFPPLQS